MQEHRHIPIKNGWITWHGEEGPTPEQIQVFEKVAETISNLPLPKPAIAADSFSIDQKLLALSFKQPYAELMLHGKIETRTWSTKYRGWVMICASKVPYELGSIREISGNEQTSRIYETLGTNNIGFNSDFERGKAIAIGRLVDCRPMQPKDELKCFVEYQPYLYCHIYEDVKQIIPIPWKGTQGWKEATEDIKRMIKVL